MSDYDWMTTQEHWQDEVYEDSEMRALADAEVEAIAQQARWDAEDDPMEWEAQQADPYRAVCAYGYSHDRKCCEDTADCLF